MLNSEVTAVFGFQDGLHFSYTERFSTALGFSVSSIVGGHILNSRSTLSHRYAVSHKYIHPHGNETKQGTVLICAFLTG